MLLAMKDEAGSSLNDEENDFMLDNSFGDETLEELTAAEIHVNKDTIEIILKEKDKIESEFFKVENEKLIIQHEVQLAKIAFKEREDRYLEDIVDLEEKLSSHDRTVYKIGQSIQTIQMLGKTPNQVYGPFLKVGLDYKNPERLKKAIAAQPKMYHSEKLYSTKLKIDSPDSEETLEVAKEMINALRDQIDVTLLEDRKRRWMSDSHNSLREFYKADVILMFVSLSKTLKELKQELMEEVQEMLNILESIEHKVEEKSPKEHIFQTEIDRLLEVSLTREIRDCVLISIAEQKNELLENEIEKFSNDFKDIQANLLKRIKILENDFKRSQAQALILNLNSNIKKRKWLVMSHGSQGVGSSNSVRRPKSNDTKSKNRVLKNTNARSSSAYVQKRLSSVIQLVLWIVDRGCSKHMTSNLQLLRNFVEKFIGTVRFGNEQFIEITRYGDYVQGNLTICHVYYVEGLGHNLFSVGQFCDGDLEVAFRSNTCYARNLEGDDLLTGSRESNLYTIYISNLATSSPVCLMSKATSTKYWLWHRRLSHLNFGTINQLTSKDLVDGILKFKYDKDHLCSACEQGKSKKASFPSKLVPSTESKLELIHMDLCGPMRVESINGKKYILVIVDDYSRYNWVYFLHTKDEAPDIFINFINQVQQSQKAQILKIRTDIGTEFKNEKLRSFFTKLGIVFRELPYPCDYPMRRLTMEEILAKFVDEGRREHEEMEILIKEFRITNELLLKTQSNLLSELKIKVNELSKVVSNVLIPKNKVKGVTTMGGKMTSKATRSKEINETGINKNEPPRFEHVQEKPHDDSVENKSFSIPEKAAHPLVKSQQSSIPFPNRVRKEKEEALQQIFLENSKQLDINILFIEALLQIPKYAKYLKSLLTNKSRLEEACTEIKKMKVLEKHKEAEDLAADHISRFESPHIEVLTEREIADKFSDEHLMVLKSKFKDDEPWYADFVNYIIGKVVPPNWTFEKRKRFLSQVKTYFWEEPYAFKLCADNIIRRCVAGSKNLEILAHCHSGPTGVHHSANITAKKVYKSRFYWPSVFKDANEYAKSLMFGDYILWDHFPNLENLQRRTKKWHNSRLRGDKDFKAGDKVLLYDSRLKMYPGKLKSKWSGLNIVKMMYLRGAIEITNMDGFSFKVNGQRLKKYYGGNIDKEDDEVIELENDATRS
ncbi:retrovirus-related pol polyprotein from transposon TNT 1-94 [Tanacetum coccineum]|uniref:Retrovirus-related pol polyprotein from transposon TNT 1-94 n=1 Tax=Tanacetum coccineum TaxID=301880 RepID=A0ABQ5AGB3_9ASTR